MQNLATRLMNWLYLKLVRPVKKYFKRRKYEREEMYTKMVMGRIIYRFEPMMVRILNEALRDYHEAMRQNYHTVQAQHDIRKFFELKLKEFTNSIK